VAALAAAEATLAPPVAEEEGLTPSDAAAAAVEQQEQEEAIERKRLASIRHSIKLDAKVAPTMEDVAPEDRQRSLSRKSRRASSAP